MGYLNVNVLQIGFWHVNTKWLLICILKTARTNHHSYGDHTSNNNSYAMTSNMHLLGILVCKSVTKIFHFFLITSDHQCFFSRGKQIAEMMKSEGSFGNSRNTISYTGLHISTSLICTEFCLILNRFCSKNFIRTI